MPPAGFYRETPPMPLDESTRRLFAFTNPGRFDTSRPEAELVDHIVACRNKTYQRTPYPCLGRFRFLLPGSRENPRYRDAIAYLTADRSRKILDMGAGYGQDVRAWLQDGVHASQIVAADLVTDFFYDGCELFADELGKGHLDGVQVSSCDVFDAAHVADLRAKSNDGFDVIYIGSFVHLFELEAQRTAVAALASLLSKRPGSFLFGRQSGMPYGKAGTYARQYVTGKDGDEVQNPYRHDPDTFAELWQAQARRAGDRAWKIQCRLQDGAPGNNWSGLSAEEIDALKDVDPVRALATGIDFAVERC